jgi:hypothetical protein
MVGQCTPTAIGPRLWESEVTAVGAIAHSGEVVPAARPRRRGHSAPHGQFFTLAAVASFLWHVVDLLAPTPHRRVLDLAAGDGILLDEGCRHGFTTTADAFGLEIDPGVVRDRAGRGARIEAGDGLLDAGKRLHDWHADLVVGNPPFGRSRDLLTDRQRRRLESEADAPGAIWGPRARTREGRFTDPAGSCRVEELFLERALRLVRHGGLVAYILSDTMLSNRRGQVARDWLGDRAHLLVAIALPASAFRRSGLNALAHLVVLRRVAEPAGGSPQTLMLERRHAKRGRLPEVLDGLLHDLRRLRSGGDVEGATLVPGADLCGRRWDPGFWVGRRALTRIWSDREDTAELGDFVELLTYGPIVTGGQPVTAADGIPSIRQGDFTETGLRASRFLRVPAGSAHDPPRSRVQPGDLLLPRSGGGALGRNRVAVYEEEEPANIGCFVDLIRLRAGLNPYYLWIFLRSRLGWGQIRSLINGVGTPNISFLEIRSLRIPLLGSDEQKEYERAYVEQVRPLHRVADEKPEARPLAQQVFLRIVRRLDERLLGGAA